MTEQQKTFTPVVMSQAPTEIVGEKCTYCIHRNDDFDCHNFCVPYNFDHYKAKEGEVKCI